nr:hypothetical protein CFP56_38450 [Quercus suber]
MLDSHSLHPQSSNRLFSEFGAFCQPRRNSFDLEDFELMLPGSEIPKWGRNYSPPQPQVTVPDDTSHISLPKLRLGLPAFDFKCGESMRFKINLYSGSVPRVSYSFSPHFLYCVGLKRSVRQILERLRGVPLSANSEPHYCCCRCFATIDIVCCNLHMGKWETFVRPP